MLKHLFFFILFFQSIAFSQNGKIVFKEKINLSKTPIWKNLSINDTLKTEYKYLENLNFYFIKYRSDSLFVNGILLEPKKVGNYPLIIFNRGGNREFGRLTVSTLIMLTSRLADNGYVIIASNYREKDEFGGSEINDVLALTETAKELNNVDTNKIGMFGWSRGGMMTYLSLKKSNKIKSAIIGNGPTDLFDLQKDRPEMETEVYKQCIPNYTTNKETLLKDRSVVYWADQLNKNSNLLILCGTKDDRVNPKQADKIAKKLSKINYDYELRKFDTDHTFSTMQNELNNLVINWFEERLKNK